MSGDPPPAGPLRVVLIGPESTGKTRLAGDLAGRYDVPWSPEYAREYVDGMTSPLSFADVDPIGRGQLAGEDAAIAQARSEDAALVLLDTDLVSTAVYSRHYYGACPEWIPPLARARRGELYLLHHVDVEWVADGHQREQPARRAELFTLFRDSLRDLGAPVADIEKGWDERRRRAIRAIDSLMASAGGRIRNRNG